MHPRTRGAADAAARPRTSNADRTGLLRRRDRVHAASRPGGVGVLPVSSASARAWARSGARCEGRRRRAGMHRDAAEATLGARSERPRRAAWSYSGVVRACGASRGSAAAACRRATWSGGGGVRVCIAKRKRRRSARGASGHGVRRGAATVSCSRAARSCGGVRVCGARAWNGRVLLLTIQTNRSRRSVVDQILTKSVMCTYCFSF